MKYAALTLVIGNYTYSSRSLRGWLALRLAGLDFETTRILLDQEDSAGRLAAASPSSRVPVLYADLADGQNLVIWDSFAIALFAAEQAPEGTLLPGSPQARMHCLSIMAEMHAGFAALRQACPMNLRRRGIRPKAPLSAEVHSDLGRISALWAETRSRFGAGGPCLFGSFSLADCFYAPVATRIRSYGLDLPDPTAMAYAEAVLQDPLFLAWQALAEAETETLPTTDRV